MSSSLPAHPASYYHPNCLPQQQSRNPWGECDVVSSPNDGVLEAQFGSGLLNLLFQPGLRSHKVLDELGDPPDGRVTMQAVQAWCQVFGDSQWQVRRPGMEAVHNGQLHHLDVLVMCLTWMDDRHTVKYAG